MSLKMKLPSCQWPVPHPEGPSESSHLTYDVHVQASGVGAVREWCVTVYG